MADTLTLGETGLNPSAQTQSLLLWAGGRGLDKSQNSVGLCYKDCVRAPPLRMGKAAAVGSVDHLNRTVPTVVPVILNSQSHRTQKQVQMKMATLLDGDQPAHLHGVCNNIVWMSSKSMHASACSLGVGRPGAGALIPAQG